MTETAGPVAMNYKKNNDYNSVGKILNVNDVKIKNADSENVGEIWVKGSNVFEGYLGDNEKEYIQDGYFYTGDIGYIKNNFLYVLGRKKNILIGDNGKNIAPEELIRMLIKYKGINDCNIVMRENKLHAIVNTELTYEDVKKIIDEVNSKLANYKKIFDFEITTKNIK
jgi:long-chain acyl-CoA synthetase